MYDFTKRVWLCLSVMVALKRLWQEEMNLELAWSIQQDTASNNNEKVWFPSPKTISPELTFKADQETHNYKHSVQQISVSPITNSGHTQSPARMKTMDTESFKDPYPAWLHPKLKGTPFIEGNQTSSWVIQGKGSSEWKDHRTEREMVEQKKSEGKI